MQVLALILKKNYVPLTFQDIFIAFVSGLTYNLKGRYMK